MSAMDTLEFDAALTPKYEKMEENLTAERGAVGGAAIEKMQDSLATGVDGALVPKIEKMEENLPAESDEVSTEKIEEIFTAAVSAAAVTSEIEKKQENLATEVCTAVTRKSKKREENLTDSEETDISEESCVFIMNHLQNFAVKEFTKYSWFCTIKRNPFQLQCTMCNKRFQHFREFIVHVSTKLHLTKMLLGGTLRHKKEVVGNLLEIFRKCIEEATRRTPAKKLNSKKKPLKMNKKLKKITKFTRLLNSCQINIFRFLDTLEGKAALPEKMEEILTVGEEERMPWEIILEKEKERKKSGGFEKFAADTVEKAFVGYSWFRSNKPGRTRFECTVCKVNYRRSGGLLQHASSEPHVDRILVGGTVQNNKEVVCNLLETFKEISEEVKRESDQIYGCEKYKETIANHLKVGKTRLLKFSSNETFLRAQRSVQVRPVEQHSVQSDSSVNHYNLRKVDKSASNSPWYGEFIAALKSKVWSEEVGGLLRCRWCKSRLTAEEFVGHLAHEKHIQNLTSEIKNPEATEILFQHLTTLEECYTSLKTYLRGTSNLYQQLMKCPHQNALSSCKKSVEKLQAYLKQRVEHSILSVSA